MKHWGCSSLTSHYGRVTMRNHSPGVGERQPAVAKEAKKQWKTHHKASDSRSLSSLKAF